MNRNSQPDRLVTDSFPRPHMGATASTNSEAVLLQNLENILTRNLPGKLAQYVDRYAVGKLGTLRRLLSVSQRIRREVYEVPHNPSEGAAGRLRSTVLRTAWGSQSGRIR